MPEDERAAIAPELLALGPEQFANEAERFLGGLSDGERGVLATALVGANAEREGESGPLIAQLRLDSADPSLMSRNDVAKLLAHLQAHDGAALHRALDALRTAPQVRATLGGLFAPSRGSSDTSSLGSDPTNDTATRDQSSPR